MHTSTCYTVCFSPYLCYELLLGFTFRVAKMLKRSFHSYSVVQVRARPLKIASKCSVFPATSSTEQEEEEEEEEGSGERG